MVERTQGGRLETEGAQDLLSRQAEAPRPSEVTEILRFIVQTRKWWLVPVFVFLALLAVLILLAGTSLAPFVYTLY